MIKINITSEVKEEIEKLHYNDIKSKLNEKIYKMFGQPKYMKLLDYLYDKSNNLNENKLKKIILGNKKDLIEVIDFIGEIKLENKDEFDNLYSNFTNRKWSKALLEKLDVNVCPYCNRQYTFTLKNDGVRPQFDHYFPKGNYSYLSVSLYNLIPSCSICNSKKHDLNTYREENELFYPYEDEFGYDVVFETEIKDYDFLCWTGESDNFEIKLKCKNDSLIRKINNTKDQLKLELLYEKHKDYVKDIIRNATIYNDSRINELLEQFPEVFRSKDEVINSIFMNYIKKDDWEKRPLAKLTHDIYDEYKIKNDK